MATRYRTIPFIERMVKTVKEECAKSILFAFSRRAARAELAFFQHWYNDVRPHERLCGSTPGEVRRGVKQTAARFEPRENRGELALSLSFVGGRRHLPIVRLRRVA